MSKQDGTHRQVSDLSVDDGTSTMLHVDMDAFYASVELLERPDLRGKPVIVAHDSPRSVVTTATYEARRYGVRAAIPLARARQLCPRAIILEPHHELYRQVSDRVMDIFRGFTPLVEQVSIDEAFLDVSGARRLYGLPGTIAATIRAQIWDVLKLRCTVGVAANKSVAKIASTLAKPDGLLIVPAAQTAAFLAPLPVRSIWGVGAVTGKSLADAGIQTVRELTETPQAVLERLVGRAAAVHLRQLSMGQDVRGIALTREEKSIGHEHTFDTDIYELGHVRRTLLGIADRTGRRLRAHGVVAGGIALKLRDEDFRTLSRSRKLPDPTDVTRVIAQQGVALLEAVWPELDGLGVRLVGLRGERLTTTPAQAALWDDTETWKSTDDVSDALQAKFGSGALLPAALLHPREKTRIDPGSLD